MFEKGNISVDDRFARFGGKSFAINKINSVEVRGETKSGSKGYFLFWLLTAIFVLSAIAQQTGVPIVIAAVFGGLGWLSWRRRHPITTYRLFLVTSSSEAQAFQTNEAGEVNQLRDAIEDAMARSN